MGSLRRFGPLAAMIALNFSYAVQNIMTRASLTGGMNPHVFVVYRQAVATLVLSPVAYILERHVKVLKLQSFPYCFQRKKRPALRFGAFCQIFISSLMGITAYQSLQLKGLYLASSSTAAVVWNSVPAITFVIAITMRLEKINIRGRRGQAKISGAFMCVGGAMIMALWKGPVVGNLWPPNLGMAVSHHLFADKLAAEHWKIGVLYLLGSCLCWSAWIIMQISTVNKYPAQISLTALMCSLGTAQSAVVALIILKPDPEIWALEWNFDLLCIIYSGIMGSGFAYSVQTWCIYERGPVFVEMFEPLTTVMVAIMASIVLHENLHAGSITGGFFIVGGLYAVLWGKSKDIQLEPHQMPHVQSLTGPTTIIKSADLTSGITEPLLGGRVSEIVPYATIPNAHL